MFGVQASELRTVPADIEQHERWRSWFLMYAELGARRLALVDTTRMPFTPDPHALGRNGRYLVGIGPEPCDSPDSCVSPSRIDHATAYYVGDDLDEAIRTFRRIEEAVFLYDVRAHAYNVPLPNTIKR
jgi:hypothetical protein